MSKSVVVLGSCVSRDLFNSRFTPEYRNEFSILDTLYQSSLPSVVRAEDISCPVPRTLKPNFDGVFRRELLGDKLAAMVVPEPDFLLVDLFTDIHLGVTKVAGLYATRNHMAFASLADADIFFDDDGKTAPDRMRFELDASTADYQEAAKQSIVYLRNFFHKHSPITKIILNSARFSNTFLDSNGDKQYFPKQDRLDSKNEAWSVLDDSFQNLTDCERITYDESYFQGSPHHPWGLHPVHYSKTYYSYMWEKLLDIVNK